ncbi:Pvc16 family protein [Allokutzneria oryzae]|uniref:Pvc16 family protein n=1 Tax=Allokutzneria oryzae TaxID=1378989 RepID=A0ABV5ZYY6_9PSEU
MISEVDEALRAALRETLSRGTLVRFDPPTPSWLAEPHPRPTVHLFLFQLRDDPSLPGVGRRELSYLVTARAEDIEREHRLLDRALRTLTASPELAADTVVRLADPGGGDLWSALGMPARAAFVIAVSAPGSPS